MAKKKTELQELSEFIRDHMATKADITELGIELKGDIAGIRKDMLTKDNLAKLDVKIDRLDLSIHRELEHQGTVEERRRLRQRDRPCAGAHRRDREAPRHRQEDRRLVDTRA